MSVTGTPYADPPQWLTDALNPHGQAFKAALFAGMDAAAEAAPRHNFDPGMARRTAAYLFAIGAGIQVPSEILATGGDALIDVELGIRDLNEAIKLSYRAVVEDLLRAQE